MTEAPIDIWVQGYYRSMARQGIVPPPTCLERLDMWLWWARYCR